MSTPAVSTDTARQDVAGLPEQSLRVMASEIEAQIHDRTLTRAQRAYVKQLLMPYKWAIRDELAERSKAA